MVSMKEIAKRCNVSVATVSKALNDYTDIGPETKNLVLKTAAEMGYLPNSSARALKTKRSYNLGVLFFDDSQSGLTHDYFNHVLESFRKTSQERGYDITFTIRKGSGRSMNYYEHCRYRGVDGVVIACVDFYADEIQELVRSNLPVVTIDHIFDSRTAVMSNNAQGMEKLVDFVYQKGHRKIAYIHGDDSAVTRARLTSFYRTAVSLGLTIPEDYLRVCPYRDADMAAQETRFLLNLPDPPTCIFYPDDYAAFGGFNEIRERGMRVPDDVSIVGFDGITAARILEPKLTTMCQDTEAIGRIAANRLINLIENPRITGAEIITVDGILFKGASVKTLRTEK
ncbi:MAG: LacI family DNA-binding transcriptional regulator [Blautia sp.]|nr:LacI family DNA-binding transcriptional regulator [Blautia sp.]